ncbi:MULTISPECIES: hypothetical protein [Bradyrhizobium]|uniref:hypothetical protein n=1 Tax=Bradyrhizobium TaxID=374 RepID=UPI00155F41EB|nr:MULTISPECIES: hypothetical protein [Bradyrhizobium]MDD1522233.1 hypothetical protein [Bradyrhizobium sp. WBAH30]MDD1546279.1 hypothetical protein [Bradyrhizobium sp. WBAH41]MDD1559740.1 hypothetical protein [Bradyrhizobium sp. WBAH23]MDD1567574.1 hypothetical protein [Bradyrhizobium sp. WBAH33]MDD1593150.1 hypothetical protein [Bradyrhizobium sp. WBAH42]
MELVKVSEAVQIVSVSTGKPHQRRVAILQRDDGHFTFAEEYSYKKVGSDFRRKAFSRAQNWLRWQVSQLSLKGTRSGADRFGSWPAGRQQGWASQPVTYQARE